MSRILRRFFIVLPLGFVLGLSGCTPRTESTSPLPDIAVALDTPISAAVSALKVIQAEVRAHAAGDRVTATAARAKLREISASKSIRDELTKGRSASDEKLASAENALLGSWVSTVMYYVDGLDFDKAEVHSQIENRAIVRVPVHRDDGGRKFHAALRVECLRQTDGAWRVARVIYFGRKGETEPAMTASRPSVIITAPASQHAPAADR